MYKIDVSETDHISEGYFINHFWDYHFLYLIKALTALDLQRNNIGAEGAKYLGNALQTNTVRHKTSISTPCISNFPIQCRHSQN